MKLDLSKISEHEVLIEGVKVFVSLDRNGNVLTVSAGAWLGGNEERITNLAIAKVAADFRRAAERVASEKAARKQQMKLAKEAEQRKKSSGNASKKSAEVRRAAAVEHWAIKYLEHAHEKNPKFGRARLVTAARKLAAAAGVEAAKRSEISSDRARTYLEHLPAKS